MKKVNVAIPSDSGQVSTLSGKLFGLKNNNKSQSLLIQGRFQPLTFSPRKKGGGGTSRNPFWFRAGFNLDDTTGELLSALSKVAIPSDSGQVSTRKFGGDSRLFRNFWVAIPSDSGQVSTLFFQKGDRGVHFLSQSLLIQGRFQQ